MKKVNAMEMRNIEGGYTVTCKYCKKSFKDQKFLWWVIKTGQQRWAQHLRNYGNTCMYAKK